MDFDESNIYRALQAATDDELKDFAKKYLYYNNEFDDIDTLRGWIAGQSMKFVNKNFDFIFNDTFIKDLSEAAHEYALTTQKQFRNDMKNGFAILKTTDDAIETTINRKLINHNKRTLVKDYNIFRDRLHSPIEDNTTLYLTKDKNEFNRNFNEIPYVKPVYDLLYDEFQQKITRRENIKVRFDVDNANTNIELKAFIDVLKHNIESNTITTEDKYIYKFFIEDRWKSFTLRSLEDWNKLVDSLERGSLVFNMERLDELFWTDGFYNQNDQELPDLSLIQAVAIEYISNTHQRGDNSGRFFHYLIKQEYEQLEPLLSKAQIFTTLTLDGVKHRSELDLNCFCYALKIASEDESNLRISKDRWKTVFTSICKICIGRTVSTKDIKDIAIKYNLYIHITTMTADHKRNRDYHKFGNQEKAILTCNLGIFKQQSNNNHYFYNYTVPVTDYFTKHVEDIVKYCEDQGKCIEWGYKVIEYRNNIFKINKSKFRPIEMIDFIYKLFRNNVFKPLSLNETIDLRSDVHHYTPKNITSLDYLEHNCKDIKFEKPVSNKGPKGHNEADPIRYFYADFEADPTGNNHIPYCCSVCCRNKLDKMKTYYGLNCTEQLLNALPNNSVTYFHHFGYDGRFIAQYGVKKAINKGSKIMSMSVKYNNKKLKFKDSWAMISKKLSDFPDMFPSVIDKKSVHKELFPYNYYTINRVKNNIGTISQAGLEERPKWNENQYKEFNENIDKISNCRVDEDHFDMKIYCKFYCEQDVRILALGHTEFRRLTLEEPIKLDIDEYISAASLANAFFTRDVYGKIPTLKQYSGVVREFIQKAVYGGRCMTNSNKKYHVTDRLSDFDACSLYPSAMARLFLPTGVPQVITEDMLKDSYLIDHVLPEDKLTPTQDRPITAFVVEIEITHVSKYLDFPLICKRTKQGNSNVNECCTMFVDNYALEDLIKYQEIKYKVIRGYYWTGPKSPKLTHVIRQVYNLRAQYKSEHNPIQEVLKLIMNSAYEKTIQKAIVNDIVYKSSEIDKRVFDEHEPKRVTYESSQAMRYLSKNFHKILAAFEVSQDITAYKTIRNTNDHYVPNLIGVQVLSLSKRIMNEVMCTAEDMKLKIYYQDTDSMHIEVESLQTLADEYKIRYKRELVGTDMGQFHTDFDHNKGGKDIVSIESYFLGKKAYCDKLVNEHNDIDYHLRMKGIPNSCLKMYAKDDFNDEPLKLYEYLFNGQHINFNILDVKPSFEMKNDMTIHSRDKFKRKIHF